MRKRAGTTTVDENKKKRKEKRRRLYHVLSVPLPPPRLHQSDNLITIPNPRCIRPILYGGRAICSDVYDNTEEN